MPHCRSGGGELRTAGRCRRRGRTGLRRQHRNLGLDHSRRWRWCRHRSRCCCWRLHSDSHWCRWWYWCWHRRNSMHRHGSGIRRRGGRRGHGRRSHQPLYCFDGYSLFRNLGRDDLRRRYGSACNCDVLNKQRLQVLILRHVHRWRDCQQRPQGREVQQRHQRRTAQPVRTTALRIVQAGSRQGANTSTPATATLDKPCRRLLARTWTKTP